MSTQCKQPQTLTFDFAVIGGGVAGTCAAIAAARAGLKTVIIQDRPMFGGNSSSEIRVSPLGSAGYSCWTRETGIIEELLLTERARNHDDVNDGMANTHYDLVLYEAVKKEPNISMFLNTTIRAVDTETCPDHPSERRIVAVRGSQLASEKEFIFKASHFADCTGDATVGALAGADFRRGREGRAEFNEPLAPEIADSQTMGSTLTMRARDVGKPVEFIAPDWIYVYKTTEEIGLHREPNKFNRVDYGGYWWIEVGTPYNQIDENQTIKEELFKHVLGVWNYVKNYSPTKQEAKNYALEWIGQVPGKRETRRLVGDVLLNENHCHKDPEWPDRIAYSGFFIDLHTMGGFLNKKEAGEAAHADSRYRHYVRIAPFSVPLRALYSRNVVNLWMAGRNISVTHVALGPTRQMMTHGLFGQAIATAAARAIRYSLTAREVSNPNGEHIKEIQQQLLKDDVNVWGIKNADPRDFARTARAIADSEAPLDLSLVSSDEPVDLSAGTMGFVVPVTQSKIEVVEVHLSNATSDDIVVPAELHELEHMWQRETGRIVAKFQFRVPARSSGWVRAEIKAQTTPNAPHRIALSQTPNISWSKCVGHPVGTLQQIFCTSPGGCEPKNKDMKTLKEIALPPYEHWLYFKYMTALTVRLTPAAMPFSAENVNNGFAWPYGMPNLWVSDPTLPLPQGITLDFGAVRRFNSAVVTFDTNLKATYHAMPGYHRSHTCAKDWRLLAQVDGKWKTVYEESGNYLRRRKVVFDAIEASRIRLEVIRTNSVPERDPAGEGRSARVYEIRVYDTTQNPL